MPASQRPRRRRRWLWWIAGAAIVVITGAQLSRLWFESPDYEVVAAIDDLEIRRYAPRVVASTEVEAGTRREATQIGFGRLAGYIFGANGAGEEGEKIAMTTPVEARPQRGDDAVGGSAGAGTDGAGGGEKIAMTTPVEARPAREGRWVISFTMPSERRLADLPSPNDDRVKLTELVPRTYAALRFGGRAEEARGEREKVRLLAKLESSGFRPVGPVEVAVYDPPMWVLPPFRRNEVLVPVEPR